MLHNCNYQREANDIALDETKASRGYFFINLVRCGCDRSERIDKGQQRDHCRQRRRPLFCHLRWHQQERRAQLELDKR